MYQKCPICNGTGIDRVAAYISKDPKCPTCKGKRIINKLTGNPPNQVNTTGVCNHEWVTMSGKIDFVGKCDICGEKRY